MLEIYSVLNSHLNFEEIGKLYIDEEKDHWEYKPEKYLDEAYLHPYCYIFGNKKENVKNWVLNRAPEFYYEAIDSVLKRAELEKYDAYGLFKFNEGRMVGDWFVCPMIQGKKVKTITDERCKEWYKRKDLGNPPIEIYETGWWNRDDFKKI